MDDSRQNRPSKNTSRPVLHALIIEDDRMVAEAFEGLLLSERDPGFSCTIAATLAQGLASLRETQFDVVLLDLGLPDSSGLDTALTVRRQFRRVPLIVLTGLRDDVAALDALREDIQDYLVKGQINGNMLVRSIRYAIERKRALDAVRESEERMRLAAQAAGFGTGDINAETGELFWSPELQRLLGLPGDRAEATPLSEALTFIHPEDRERVKQLIAASQDPAGNGKFGGEHRVVRSDGSVIWVLTRGQTFFRDEAERRRAARTIAVMTDITERKRAEESLRKNEERLRMVVEAAHALIYEVELKSNRVVIAMGLREVLGYDPSEIFSTRSWWDGILHPDDRLCVYSRVKEMIKTGRSYSIEYRVLHSRGTYITVQETGKAFRDKTGKVAGFVGSVIDITERKRSEEALRESEERFRTLADNIAQLAWMADGLGRSFWYNERWYDYTGLAQEDMQRDGWQKVLHPDQAHSVLDRINRHCEAGEAWEETVRLKGRADGYRWFLCRAIPIRNEQGKVIRWFGTSTDITERMRMEDEIRHMAQHDILTGLPNKRLFNAIIDHELAQARRQGKKVALFYLDLDRFKEINDTFGHEAGDELLRQAAARLKAAIRTSDTIARIGGDEFNIILPNIDRGECAAEVAQKIFQEIRKPFTIRGRALRISASIGISVFPHDDQETDALLHHADLAMYHVKETGKDSYQFYNPVINTRSLERRQVESDLHRAIDQNEFRLYYQPLIDIKTGKIVSAEALLRWHHPERGLLAPLEFLRAADDIGFMPVIDDWVLKTAAGQIGAGAMQRMRVRIAVNLSARQFQRPEFTARVPEILETAGMPLDCLDIEITESAFMNDNDRVAALLGHLHARGVRVAIDNFGSGCSSLRNLKRMPIDRLKIDRSLIREVSQNADDRAIIVAVTSMAHDMGMRAVAEGVETEEQISFLRSTGCDEAQGFLFGRPLPVEKFRELVSAGK